MVKDGESGKVIGEEAGVVTVLDVDEVLDDSEERPLNEVSDVKDEERELDDKDREGEGASDIAGLVLR